MPVFMFITLCPKDPDSLRFAVERQAQKTYQNRLGGNDATFRFAAWWLVTIVEPIKDFFARFGYIAMLILLFIIFFKIGEAFLGRMTLAFYKEIGFTTAQIATYSQLAGSTLTVIFSLVASVITVHFGQVRGLMTGGISIAAPNLILA